MCDGARVLCDGAPFMFLKRISYSGIQTSDSKDKGVNHSATWMLHSIL